MNYAQMMIYDMLLLNYPWIVNVYDESYNFISINHSCLYCL